MDNNNTTQENDDIATLENDIREAVAKGTDIQDTVHRITLKAMKADRLDIESIRRIVTAVMQGIHQGAEHQLQHTTDQAHTAKTQISDAISGLDAALARLAEASKLALQEAAGNAKQFSEKEPCGPRQG